MKEDMKHQEEIAPEEMERQDIIEGEDVTVEEAQADEGPSMEEATRELEQRLMRLQADFDNFRKRTQAEKEQLSDFVKGDMIGDLLSVVDNFERALAVDVQDEQKAFMEGFAMIQQNLIGTLEKHGLKEIDALGKEFDPAYHQAVMNGPSDEYEDNQVCQVLQKGYTVRNRLIRPAMVKVTQN